MSCRKLCPFHCFFSIDIISIDPDQNQLQVFQLAVYIWVEWESVLNNRNTFNAN